MWTHCNWVFSLIKNVKGLNWSHNHCTSLILRAQDQFYFSKTRFNRTQVFESATLVRNSISLVLSEIQKKYFIFYPRAASGKLCHLQSNLFWTVASVFSWEIWKVFAAEIWNFLLTNREEASPHRGAGRKIPFTPDFFVFSSNATESDAESELSLMKTFETDCRIVKVIWFHRDTRAVTVGVEHLNKNEVTAVQ